MDFFNDIGKSVSDIGKIGGLKSLIYDEKKKVDSLYKELGTLYYEHNKFTNNSLFSAQIMAIRDSLAKIDSYNNQIALLKSGKVCAKCGNPMTEKDVFCSVCGAKAEVPVAENKMCRNCGTVTPGAGAFCPVCGTKYEAQPAQTKACTSCGAPLSENDVFCMTCGAKVATAQTAPEAPVVQEVPAAEVAPEEPVVQEAPAVEEPAPEAVQEIQTQESVWTPEAVAEEEDTTEEAPVAEIIAEEPAVQEAPAVEVPAVQEAAVVEAPVPEAVQEDEELLVNPYQEIVKDNVCSVCNREVLPTAKFCIYCGTKR